ncbi:MAG TPA: hypothetical protein VJP45_07035 [Candidatus Limnocylindria bacterium]|nr:hypothetical protein [Candidatus Limnocylindria bacterium]
MAVGVFALAGMIGTAGVANADGEDYESNPGRQQSFTVSCNAGHGAFGIFEGERGAWVPAAAQEGGIGDSTGPANSGAAATCRAQ